MNFSYCLKYFFNHFDIKFKYCLGPIVQFNLIINQNFWFKIIMISLR